MSEKKHGTHVCPHCGSELETWIAPPETWWGEILVCNNNECPYFKDSNESIYNKRDDSRLGCRYAIDPGNEYKPFNLLAWCPTVE